MYVCCSQVMNGEPGVRSIILRCVCLLVLALLFIPPSHYREDTHREDTYYMHVYNFSNKQ